MGWYSEPVDEQRLGRTAYTGAAHLGIDDDLARHCQIGRGIDVDVAQPLKMGKHRHTSFSLHSSYQAFAAARNDHVEISIETFEHFANGSTIGGRH